MKALITGLNGTVAPFVRRELVSHSFTVIPWDRTSIPPEDEIAGHKFLLETRPDWLLHIGMGEPAWAGFLARESHEWGIKFLFTSTVSVYADRKSGPITPQTMPDGTDGYAQYKLECETLIRAANPEAIIARLPWQIGSERGTNNMFEHLHGMADENGVIHASTRWFPACAFLEDTAEMIFRLRKDYPASTYLVDSNKSLNFFQIASALNRLHGSPWKIVPTRDFVLDLRMVDTRINTPDLASRLGL